MTRCHQPTPLFLTLGQKGKLAAINTRANTQSVGAPRNILLLCAKQINKTTLKLHYNTAIQYLFALEFLN